MRGVLTAGLLAAVAAAAFGCGGGGGASGTTSGGGTTGGGTTGGGTTGGGTTGGGTTGGSTGGAIGQVFPGSDLWNTDVSNFPIDPLSSQYIASINRNHTTIHPDFGQGTNGIPFNVVHAGQPLVNMTFLGAPSESDAGPYPVPPNPAIEAGSDAHCLVVDVDNRVLYEFGNAAPDGRGGWTGYSGAIFNLSTDAPRPIDFTSADAAGLPIFPGLVRYDEASSPQGIRHALRFTVQISQKAFIFPARHQAGSTRNADDPPMGLRLRLRRTNVSFDINTFSPVNRAIIVALQTYGMMVADNGQSWFISGAPDSRWDDNDLNFLKAIRGDDFEVVNTGQQVVTR